MGAIMNHWHRGSPTAMRAAGSHGVRVDARGNSRSPPTSPRRPASPAPQGPQAAAAAAQDDRNLLLPRRMQQPVGEIATEVAHASPPASPLVARVFRESRQGGTRPVLSPPQAPPSAMTPQPRKGSIGPAAPLAAAPGVRSPLPAGRHTPRKLRAASNKRVGRRQ
jgi:hypothetical protein